MTTARAGSHSSGCCELWRREGPRYRRLRDFRAMAHQLGLHRGDGGESRSVRLQHLSQLFSAEYLTAVNRVSQVPHGRPRHVRGQLKPCPQLIVGTVHEFPWLSRRPRRAYTPTARWCRGSSERFRSSAAATPVLAPVPFFSMLLSKPVTRLTAPATAYSVTILRQSLDRNAHSTHLRTPTESISYCTRGEQDVPQPLSTDARPHIFR